MVRGEALGAFSLSESGAGSDAASLSARAVREGDDWVVDGEKMWVTNGATADLVLLFARTDEPGDRRGVDGIGGFVVPTGAPGWQPYKEEKKMGLRGSETVAVALDGLRLPADHLVGEPDQGFRYALQALNAGRLGIAAQALGIGQAALDLAVEYAAEREQFGKAIGKHQGLRFELADMATEVAAARALTHSAARLVDDDVPAARRYASMAKLRASEAAMAVTRQAVQVFGGYGYMREYPVERLFRDAKVTEIYEGTSEIHRLIIGQQLFAEKGLDQ
jgi:alkylation response protein AidB-like acyl-CoA dehydrogenase